jgi:hypothetical protein
VSDFACAASDELVSGNKSHTLGTYVPPREQSFPPFPKKKKQSFPHLSCIFLIYLVHPADKFWENIRDAMYCSKTTIIQRQTSKGK